MYTFKITAGKPSDNDGKFRFYVLCKGLNSGKPLKNACPNCFTVISEDESEINTLYWLSFALWKGKRFEILLTGSVIPFIRLSDYKKIIQENASFVYSNQDKLFNVVDSLQTIEKHELMLSENLKKVKQLKAAYAQSLFSNHNQSRNLSSV